MMGLSLVGTSLAMKFVMASVDPNRDAKKKVQFTPTLSHSSLPRSCPQSVAAPMISAC